MQTDATSPVRRARVEAFGIRLIPALLLGLLLLAL
jgi:hypothetical protein